MKVFTVLAALSTPGAQMTHATFRRMALALLVLFAFAAAGSARAQAAILLRYAARSPRSVRSQAFACMPPPIG